MSETDEERQAQIERVAARKRYNMKSLGRLVDSNRLTGVARPAELDTERPLPHRSREEPPEEHADTFETVDEPNGIDPAELEQPTSEPAAPEADDGEPGIDDSEPTESAAQVVEEPEVEAQEQTDELQESVVEDAEPIGFPTGDEDVIEDPAVTEVDSGAELDFVDGVDRTGIGTQVTRTGLSTRIEEFSATDGEADASLARRMLDSETRDGGRISDPREVSGIVLDLANDIPASVAVSVVRMDEEVEIVGDTVDPGIDREMFSSTFSKVFTSVQPAAQVLTDGPLGKVLDVVIEGERLDMILRPLGQRYYLMVLEERKHAQADLATTRRRMATIAPALTAILTQQDGGA